MSSPPEAMPPDAADYAVGYRRPPAATRFAPGISGNPRGRPKAPRDLAAVVAAALGEKIAVTDNGRPRRMTKLEAAVRQLVDRAVAGEPRATQLLLAYVAAREAPPDAAAPDGAADAIVLAELLRRLGRSGA